MTVIHTPPWGSTTWTMELFTKELTELYKLDGVWSERCSRIFESLPMAVFKFDKIRQFFKSINCIVDGKTILVDPLTVLCLNCKKFVRLKGVNNIQRYVLHLACHFDSESAELMKRLQRAINDGFQESLQQQYSVREYSSELIEKLRTRFVGRDINPNTHYIAHWINQLLVSTVYKP